MELTAHISPLNHKSRNLPSKPIFVSATSACFSPPFSHRTPPNAYIALNHTRNSFLGHIQQQATATLQIGHSQRATTLPPVIAVIKKYKDRALDNVIQSQKKLKLVTKVKQILLRQPNRTMSVRELGKHRRYLGLLGRRRIISLLRRYPGVFQVFEEDAYCMHFRLTPEAEAVHLEESQIRRQMEGLLVDNLRKLLMMSASKRVLLEKIGHLGNDMGLPIDFKTNLCNRYPQYFRVVDTDYGPALELTSWDPALAVSAAEKKAQEDAKHPKNDLIIDRPRKFKRLNLPNGYNLSRKHRDYVLKFQELPFICPYSDVKGFYSASMESEKHACAVIHELLSLTLEKKTLVDHLTHFRHDFKFCNKVRGMLLRHPELFYVSFKGDRDSVFLREAYRGSELIEKNPLLLARERLQVLVSMRKSLKRQMADWQSRDGAGGNDKSLKGDGDLELDPEEYLSDDGIEMEDEEDDDNDEDDNWNEIYGEEGAGTASDLEFAGKVGFFKAPTLMDQAEKELATASLDAGSRENW